MDAFFSKLFGVQLTTSGLWICCSGYCLAFVIWMVFPLLFAWNLDLQLQNRGDNSIEWLVNLIILVYSIFDIFMVMYCGNEITLASDRLSYALFESDWVDQPQSTKKNIIIFGELPMQPCELIILELYPLTLETFTRVRLIDSQLWECCVCKLSCWKSIRVTVFWILFVMTAVSESNRRFKFECTCRCGFTDFLLLQILNSAYSMFNILQKI